MFVRKHTSPARDDRAGFFVPGSKAGTEGVADILAGTKRVSRRSRWVARGAVFSLRAERYSLFLNEQVFSPNGRYAGQKPTNAVSSGARPIRPHQDLK